MPLGVNKEYNIFLEVCFKVRQISHPSSYLKFTSKALQYNQQIRQLQGKKLASTLQHRIHYSTVYV